MRNMRWPKSESWKATIRSAAMVGAARRQVAFDHGLGLYFGLAVAFAARDLQEQQLLVGEIGVDRRLRHPGLARDIVDQSALEPIA